MFRVVVQHARTSPTQISYFCTCNFFLCNASRRRRWKVYKIERVVLMVECGFYFSYIHRRNWQIILSIEFYISCGGKEKNSTDNFYVHDMDLEY